MNGIAIGDEASVKEMRVAAMEEYIAEKTGEPPETVPGSMITTDHREACVVVESKLRKTWTMYKGSPRGMFKGMR